MCTRSAVAWRACAATWSACGPGRNAWTPWPSTVPRWLPAPGCSAAAGPCRPFPVACRRRRTWTRSPAAGALHDGAMRLVASHVPAASDAELLAGLVAGQSHLHALGITHYQDACVG